MKQGLRSEKEEKVCSLDTNSHLLSGSETASRGWQQRNEGTRERGSEGTNHNLRRPSAFEISTLL